MIGIHLSTPEMRAVHRAGRAAADRRGAGVPRPRRAMGRDRARLQRDPVDPAADPRLRAQRLAGRAGGLDPGEVAVLGGQRRRPRRPVRPRRPADDADASTGSPDSITSSMRDYYDNRWHGTPIGPDDFVARADRDGGLRQRVRPRGRAAAVLVRAAVRHPALDRLPARRSLRRGRGARPARRRHRGLLRRSRLGAHPLAHVEDADRVPVRILEYGT